MRSISIQVQPNLAPVLAMDQVTDVFRAIASIKRLVKRHQFDSGESNGPYYNYTFGTEQALELWREIKARLYEDPELGPDMRTASIATCSSETGWGNYILLRHFDPTVILDSEDELL